MRDLEKRWLPGQNSNLSTFQNSSQPTGYVAPATYLSQSVEGVHTYGSV